MILPTVRASFGRRDALHLVDLLARRDPELRDAALEIHELCLARRVPVWCGGMLESGVGRAPNVALATLPGVTRPGALSPSQRYWERDLVDPGWDMIDGSLVPLAAPGIGVVPDRARIEADALRRHAVG